MTATIAPYLNFRDRARDAMTFYASVLGGELTFSTFGEFSMSDDPADRDKIMHAQIVIDGRAVLMASDAPSSMATEPGPEGFSVALFGAATDAAWLRACFDGLAEGGTIAMPLAKAPWGDEFGMLQDRFGVDWMIDIAPE